MAANASERKRRPRSAPAFALCLVGVTLAYTPSHAGGPRPDPAQAAIRGAYARLAAALRAEDAGALARCLAPGFVFDGPDGKMDRARYEAYMRAYFAAFPPFVRFDYRIAEVRVSPARAVVVVEELNVRMEGGLPPPPPVTVENRLRYRDTWIPMKDGWRLRLRSHLPGGRSFRDGREQLDDTPIRHAYAALSASLRRLDLATARRWFKPEQPFDPEYRAQVRRRFDAEWRMFAEETRRVSLAKFDKVSVADRRYADSASIEVDVRVERELRRVARAASPRSATAFGDETGIGLLGVANSSQVWLNTPLSHDESVLAVRYRGRERHFWVRTNEGWRIQNLGGLPGAEVEVLRESR